MKVVLLSPNAVIGGTERVVAGLAKHLPSFGVETRVVLLEEGPLEDWLNGQAKVICAGRLKSPRTAKVIRELRRFCRDSVVLSHNAKGHIYGGLVGRPAYWWQHNAPGEPLARIATRIPAKAVICATEQIASAQRGRTVVIPPGIDVDEIARRRGSGQKIREELGTPIVGIVGRLQAWKGQDVLLRAPIDAHKLIVGGTFALEPDYPDTLHGLANGRVTFAGEQPDPYPWMDAMDVVVHTSRGEPFGLVLLEAMALGKPVVAAADGGPSEILTDGSGLLYPPGDHHALADAVNRILSDPESRRRLQEGARRRVEDFTARETARKVAALLAQ
jgi:glycosyltransferase involved in cell wall biosynthesis